MECGEQMRSAKIVQGYAKSAELTVTVIAIAVKRAGLTAPKDVMKELRPRVHLLRVKTVLHVLRIIVFGIIMG